MPPDILLLFTDQQRFDTIAALGNPLIRTPALDRLAREGVSFGRCYTPSPVCVSARCALITGRSPHRTGCVDNMPMPADAPSLMERLRDAGYQTHGAGKMHFHPDLHRAWGFDSRDISEEMNTDRDDYWQSLAQAGYDHLDDFGGLRSEYYYLPQPSQAPARLHHSTWVADRAIDFLRRRDRSRPFFLWASFIKPHPPFDNPAPWYRLYRAAEMPPPFRPEGYGRLLNFWNRVQNRYKYRDAGFDDLMLRTMRAAYYACISFVDANIGRILEALGEAIDRTLILFTSDHGELLGDYGSFGKRCMLDAAARVPLLARWPGRLPAGARCGAPASLIDVWPTVLNAAGLDSAGAEGVDLAELAGGGASRGYVISQFSERQYGLYLVAGSRWKYIYSAADEREWLFDAQTDPHETRNLAGNPACARQAADMRAALIRRFQADGYTAPLDGDGWRRYGPAPFPDEPDYGLLFQDSPRTQPRVDALDGYARPATAPPEQAASLFHDIQRRLSGL